MSYDTRKLRRDQEFYEEVELVLDACKYTVGDFWSKRELINTSYVGYNYHGDIDVSGPAGWSDLWATASGDIYLKNGDETIRAEIFFTGDDTTIRLLSRETSGASGTEILAGGKLYLMHSGEEDGTCRGYPHNCSTADSYDPDSKRQPSFATGQRAGGLFRLPGLRHGSCDHRSAEIDPGWSIGSRARFTVKIADQRNNDYGFVPYPDRRSESGTMFGKLLARHPYMQGREIIYRAGLRDANTYGTPDFIERRYIIDSVQLSDDVFTINALDPLILTEDKKSKIPTASPARLSAAITGTPASFSYIDAPDYYFGAMSAVLWVRIDSEVIEVEVTGATQLSVVTRGYRSTSKNHDAGASIQDCVRFAGTNGVDAIVFSLNNYTRTPAQYIGDYSATVALLPTFEFDEAFITKPIAVIDFINMIIRLGNLDMYFNEEIQEIVINYVPEGTIQPISIDGMRHLERDSIRVDQNIKNQFTRHSHLWGPVDITKNTEENFAIRYLQVNSALEDESAMGEVNEKPEFKDLLLTTSADDSLIGTTYVNRVLSQTTLPPKIITAKIKSDFVGTMSGGTLGLGSVVSLSTQENQDKDGLSVAELYRVVKLDGNAYENYDVKFKRYISQAPQGVDFTISADAINYDLSDHYTPTAGSYTILIDTGVTLGSYNTAIPSFTTGTQAVGVSFTIINRGAVLGMGGIGGDFGDYDSAATAGEDGGDAFELTVPCIIDTGSGLIWSGGGGGGAQKTGIIAPGSLGFNTWSAATGGSGGQGCGTSLGGFYYVGGNTSIPPATPGSGRRPSGNQSGPGLGGFLGGEWGKNGTNGQNYPGFSFGFSLGGSAGAAIKTNGNSVTITSGNNEFNIRGPIV